MAKVAMGTVTVRGNQRQIKMQTTGLTFLDLDWTDADLSS